MADAQDPADAARPRPVRSVSVLMPTWQGMEFLDRVLDALDVQSCALPWELVVVDSGSTDGTVERLMQRAPDLSFPLRVRTIRSVEFDHGDTRNLLATEGTGDLFVFLTQDAIPTRSDWLGTIVANFDDPSVGAVYCRNVARADATVAARLMCRSDPGYATVGSRATRPAPESYTSMSPAEKRQLYNFNDVASAVRRELWERYPFPRTMMGEDVLMARGLIEAGFDVVYDAAATVDHSHDYGPEKLHWRGEVDARFNAEWLDRICVGSVDELEPLIDRLVAEDLRVSVEEGLERDDTLESRRALESKMSSLRGALVQGLFDGGLSPKRYARSAMRTGPRLSLVLLVERLPRDEHDLAGRYPFALGRELLDRGHEVTIALRAPAGSDVPDQHLGVRVAATADGAALSAWLEEREVDVVHAFCESTSLEDGLRAAIDADVATILSAHGAAANRDRVGDLAELAGCVDRVLVPTVPAYEQLLDGDLLDQNRLVLSAPGIESVSAAASRGQQPVGDRVRALVVGDRTQATDALLAGIDPDRVDLRFLGPDLRSSIGREASERGPIERSAVDRAEAIEWAEVAVVVEESDAAATLAALECRARDVPVLGPECASSAAWLDPGVVLERWTPESLPGSLAERLATWRGRAADAAPARRRDLPVRSIGADAAEMEYRYRGVAAIDRGAVLRSAPLLDVRGDELSVEGRSVVQGAGTRVLTFGAEARIALDGVAPGPVWLIIDQLLLGGERDVRLGGRILVDDREVGRLPCHEPEADDRALSDVLRVWIPRGARSLRIVARYETEDASIHLRIGRVAVVRRGASSTGPAPADALPRPSELLQACRALAVSPGPPVARGELPSVAIVIPSLDGAELLAECLPSLAALDYPAERVRVLVVDNGSADDTLVRLARDHADVRTVPLESNAGFAAACNRGAAEAGDAELIVFVNNDMRFEVDFLTELVSPVARGECDASTGRRMSWDGRTLDGAGVGSTFVGIAVQPGFGEPLGPEHEIQRRTLFPCGGAMAIRREAFEQLGGFDEDYFAYYEDLDLGWRAWIAGLECHYVPSAVCEHHHSHTGRRLRPHVLRRMVIRNSLLTCIKNYDDDNLARVLPAMTALAVERAFLKSGLDADDFSPDGALLSDTAEPPRAEPVEVDAIGAADLVALHDVFGNWAALMEKRRAVQAQRKVPDAAIFSMFLEPLACVESEASYQELQSGLIAWLGLDGRFGSRPSDDRNS